VAPFHIHYLPHPPCKSSLSPYTTLFRSELHADLRGLDDVLIPVQIGLVADRGAADVGHQVAENEGTDTWAARGCMGDEIALVARSEEHTSELQSPDHLVCPRLLESIKHA